MDVLTLMIELISLLTYLLYFLGHCLIEHDNNFKYGKYSEMRNVKPMLSRLGCYFSFLFFFIFIDNGIYMTEQFVQTVSSVNYNKGIFSLYFVGQDPLKMAQGVMAESDNELALKQTVHMPAAGFMYMVSMIKNMLEDPRMAAEFDKLIAAGLIPAAPSDEQQAAPAATAQAAPRKKK